MQNRHIRACDGIVSASEPWLTLGEGVDFRRFISLKQAYVSMTGSGVHAEPAGFIIFTPEPVFARGGYLRAIGVDSHARRNGVGRSLVSFAERETARRCPNFYLCVSSFNRQARSFYRKLGYVPVGKLPDLLMPGATEYIYWKRLRPRR